MGRLYSEIDKLALFVGDKRKFQSRISKLLRERKAHRCLRGHRLSLAGKTAEAIVRFRDMLERDKSLNTKLSVLLHGM